MRPRGIHASRVRFPADAPQPQRAVGRLVTLANWRAGSAATAITIGALLPFAVAWQVSYQVAIGSSLIAAALLALCTHLARASRIRALAIHPRFAYLPELAHQRTRLLSDRSLAEDVVQEVFLTVWRQADSFREQRGAVRPWLLTVVHHRAIDALRKRRPGANESLDLARHDLPTPDAWADVYAHLSQQQIREALLQLPPDQREAIELAYFSGLTQQEIAQRLQTPLGTIKGRMRLALQKLKTSLDDLRPQSFP